MFGMVNLDVVLGGKSAGEKNCAEAMNGTDKRW